MKKLIAWCKEYWLLISGCALLAFIPLYPKLPLLDVFQTWVYIRLEDFLVALVLGGVVLMLWRQKLFPKSPLTVPIVVYWLVGLLSLVVAVFSEQTPLSEFKPHLGLLHFLRRIEYMGLFFIGYFAVMKKPRSLHTVVWTLVITTVAIVAYGFGQKLFGFPAFLTMNEEFAKGLPLRLPPTARIPSTFGGHYDLGAFLVFVIPIFGALALGAEKVWQRLVFLAVAALSLVGLLLTASRISFGVYLVAIAAMLVWKKKIWLILPVFIVSFVLLNSVSTASERFYKTLRFSDVVIDLSTGQPIGTLETLEGGTATIEKQESPATENLPKGSEFISVPQVAEKPTKTVKTIEVYTSSPLATGSGEIATVSGSFLVQKAFVYDISITTRFQGQWPKAIAAFRRNMVLGSGYSSLNVASDGDYFRMLGETGILGTAAFLGIFLMAFFLYFRRGNKVSNFSDSFVTGIFAGLVGLLINGVLIDVFEASKVAFPFWFLMGVAVAQLTGTPGERTSYARMWWKIITSKASVILAIAGSVLLLYGKALTFYFMGDDFTWLRWSASTVSTDIAKYFTDAGGFFYRPVPKLVYFILYSFFWLKPWGYHLTLLALFAFLAILIFVLMERRGVRRGLAGLTALLFVSLALHHENVVWISGLSSMLTAVSTLLAVVLVAHLPQKNRLVSTAMWGGVWVLTFAAMLSYEGGIVAPLLVAYAGRIIFGVRSAQSLFLLFLIPAYVVIRNTVHAVSPGGDYSIRWSRFPVNAIGNTAAYLSGILVGPRALELFALWRESAKHAVSQTAAIGVVSMGAVILLLRKHAGSLIRRYKAPMVWLVAAGIAIAPFVGLGIAVERYGLLASVFIILAIGEWAEIVWQRHERFVRFAIILLLCLAIGWNAKELGRVMGDWQKASDVSQTTMLSLKHTFFPLQDKQAFAFVNTPIRYGRAWIFPTGLNDAMWHMFKFNPYPYLVYSAPSVEEAFKLTTPLGTPAVLLFEDMTLKVAQHTTKVIEVDEP